MTKLEVSQWQFDEIESIIRRNPRGPEWLETLTVSQIHDIYPIDEILYVFFGPVDRLLRWKRENQAILNDTHTFAVIHAEQHHKVQGSRAKTKRVYDIDNDKTWYWDNYHNPNLRQTLENMYELEYRYGQA